MNAHLRAVALPVAAFALVLLGTTSAFAGQQTGQVTELITRANDGLIYFFMSGPASGRPGCATAPYWMIKDENSPAGKRQLAILLAARTSGRSVTVTGSNTCTRWPDGEDVNEISY